MKTKSKLNVKFTFKPFSKKQLQVLFWWQSPQYKDKFAIIADGSVRAGKTVIMSFSYVRWAMMNFDGVNFGMAGKTIGSLRRNVIRDLKRMLISEHYHVKDNQSENMLTVSKNGKTNYFFLFGGTNEASQDLVQGITLGGFFFDEVALMPESFVAQATSRLSVEGSKAWFNCNPDSPYHWFKLQWIDQLAKKNAIRIHFLMKDNPSLSEETLRRYDSMYSGVFYLRYILGQWAMADGLVYDNFDREKMVVDIPKEPVWEKQWISIDYGTQNATVFKLWSLFKGTWYNNAEYYYSGRETGRQKTDEQYIFLTYRKTQLFRSVVSVVADKYFKLAGIAPKGRHHGSHSLRMTFASELVAEDVPLEAVSRLLGHEDNAAISHYVALSTESLRSCALPVPEAGGKFADYLKEE